MYKKLQKEKGTYDNCSNIWNYQAEVKFVSLKDIEKGHLLS